MSQQVPSPYESRNEAQSFFDDLTGAKSSQKPAEFSLGGFSSDSVLDLFRNETNAMLKGEISKIKDLSASDRLNLELRLSGWKDRVDIAINRIDERIQVLANVQAPQKREAARRDAEEKRPFAFALLKAIKSGLLQQTQELSKVQHELIATQLASVHGDLIVQIAEFFGMPQDAKAAEKKFDQFIQIVLQNFSDSYGQKGFAGLALFLQSVQKQIPQAWRDLFIKQFLLQFQANQKLEVTLGSNGSIDALLQLHEMLAPHFAPDEPGVTVTMTDESGVLLQYARGLFDLKSAAPMNEQVPIAQGSLTSDYLTLLATKLIDKGLLHLEDEIFTYLPELKNAPHKITIEQLLTKKSGLPDVDMLVTFSGMDPVTTSADTKLKLLQELLPRAMKPGSDEKAASSTNNLLLAKIIEQITGKSIQEYAKNLVQFGSDESAIIYVYNEESAVWEEKPFTPSPYEAVTTPKERALIQNSLLDAALGAYEEEVIEFSTLSGFSLLFFGTANREENRRFSLYLATNREDADLGPHAQEIVETFSPTPIYGLAFVPFPFLKQDKEQADVLAENEKLEKLLQRFAHSYRSEELMVTWKFCVKKQTVQSLGKEYLGLETEQLFFIPIEIGDEKATFILADRPTCKLTFSKSECTLQDPSASIAGIVFKKV